MKIIMSIITGLLFGSIANSLGFHPDNWKWWAFMALGSIYIAAYNDLKNIKFKKKP